MKASRTVNKTKIILPLIFLQILIYSCRSYSPSKNEYFQNILRFQDNLNKEFADKKISPLDSVDLLNFKKLDFFPIDKKYRVVARFKKNPNPTPFEFPTNTSRTPVYVKYGDAYFTIDGKNLHLEIYQNQEALKDTVYKDYLFLPFGDKTNGNESYYSGRYIDLKIPADSTKIIIDFNKAYNPYCAYSHRWSCPLIPPANILDIEIRAGVKKFNHKKRE